MSDVRSRLPRLTLYYELAGDVVGEERIINPTLIAWDRYAAHRAGTADDPKGSNVLLYTWCLWYQLKAKGITDADFKTFSTTECLHVTDTLLDDEPTEELPDTDPTQPGHAPGS